MYAIIYTKPYLVKNKECGILYYVCKGATYVKIGDPRITDHELIFFDTKESNILVRTTLYARKYYTYIHNDSLSIDVLKDLYNVELLQKGKYKISEL